MTLKYADEEQSKLFNVLKDLNRGVKPVEKRAVINNIRLFLTEKEKKYLNSFRTKIFPIKYTRPEQALNPTPEKTTEKTPGPAYETTWVKTPEQAPEPLPKPTPNSKVSNATKTTKKTKRKISLKLLETFLNKIENEEKVWTMKYWWTMKTHFGYHIPSFLVKNLNKVN